jgi:hypothetical protein
MRATDILQRNSKLRFVLRTQRLKCSPTQQPGIEETTMASYDDHYVKDAAFPAAYNDYQKRFLSNVSERD